MTAADCSCILFVTKTIVYQLTFVLIGGKQFIQLQQLNTDLILILTFAIDYLHFVFKNLHGTFVKITILRSYINGYLSPNTLIFYLLLLYNLLFHRIEYPIRGVYEKIKMNSMSQFL